jgi:hypothetical protein
MKILQLLRAASAVTSEITMMLLHRAGCPRTRSAPTTSSAKSPHSTKSYLLDMRHYYGARKPWRAFLRVSKSLFDFSRLLWDWRFVANVHLRSKRESQLGYNGPGPRTFGIRERYARSTTALGVLFRTANCAFLPGLGFGKTSPE